MSDETFHIDQKFMKSFNALLNKHWVTHMRFDIDALLDDICKYFLCTASTLMTSDSQGRMTSIAKYPSGEDEGILTFLRDSVITNYVATLVPGDQFTGATFSLNRDTRIIELDLIPLPVAQEYSYEQSIMYFFVLLDAAALSAHANHGAERNHQRDILSLFFVSWWARAWAPKLRKTLTTTHQNRSKNLAKDAVPTKYDDGSTESTQSISPPLPNWLRVGTLPELINKAIADAQNVRRKSPATGKWFFAGEQDDNRFNWEEWQPLLPTLKE